ncbi:UBA/THIF-type NAD/FAD binding protein [Bacillus methanolicus PB1]|uniref:UBA/THIF-type NAD/FAD binding protein n=1 Tax=Bacillus methanolicus PB1 TaxID=997296 RepID=I3E0U7_BACMT|nr:ThiF family adenylyltransferase [Bacillus methanolicus]EIJ80118.1 UBA/THIF-type NAD/FAD binding protein [Bacillus methanolicus PB1]
MNRTKLRLTGRQHAALYKHLFPGDGKEAVVLALCGVGEWRAEDGVYQRSVCIHKIYPVPYDACSVRREDRVTWSTEILHGILPEAQRKKLVILKIHSHPTGLARFSSYDDESDQELFKGLSGWLNTDFPGISAIMLQDGRMIARVVNGEGLFNDVVSISVGGPDLKFWQTESLESRGIPDFMIRTAQAFGQGTTELLSRLSIGVVGVSGTGSPVVEMLFRLGVGELVLVDGDIVEEKNVNRIYNSTMSDALEARLKVDLLAAAIHRTGLPTKVVPIPKDLFHPEVVRRLAQCDVIFGCMDSVDGRDLLNRLCTFYSIPYFDLGVFLDADGQGGVDQVCGTVHYLQPDGSSLFSRGVYTEEELRASALRRTDPEQYREQVDSKYIRGVQVDRPAVISVNTLVASLAVNDFLARVHLFRDDPNEDIASLRVSLNQTRLIPEQEGEPCRVLEKFTGRGDLRPLLNMPILSERSH